MKLLKLPFKFLFGSIAAVLAVPLFIESWRRTNKLRQAKADVEAKLKRIEDMAFEYPVGTVLRYEPGHARWHFGAGYVEKVYSDGQLGVWFPTYDHGHGGFMICDPGHMNVIERPTH